MQRQITAGAFQELDQSKLPNAANLWDVIENTHRERGKEMPIRSIAWVQLALA
jgi:spermidine/putrescine-binding protein